MILPPLCSPIFSFYDFDTLRSLPTPPSHPCLPRPLSMRRRITWLMCVKSQDASRKFVKNITNLSLSIETSQRMRSRSLDSECCKSDNALIMYYYSTSSAVWLVLISFLLRSFNRLHFNFNNHRGNNIESIQLLYRYSLLKRSPFDTSN